MKLLYVCTDLPYPPIHGGLVDMWNRIHALHGLGVELDVVATVADEPSKEDRRCVESLVRRLILCPRKRGGKGIFSVKPGHCAIRSSLRKVRLEDDYDAVLLETEFTSEILLNNSLRAGTSIIRVANDECRFALQTMRSERSWLLKVYFLAEALRIWLHSARTLPSVNMLWFISLDERERYDRRTGERLRQATAFLPTAVNLSFLAQPPLAGRQVLFVGNLWAAFNLQAVEWYLSNVHSRLSDIEGYSFAITGSTRGQGSKRLEELCARFNNVSLHFDVEDTSPCYESSAVFVNPMQRGAGVKLKTVEAALRGLPIVSTGVGAEGSGLVDEFHYRRAEDPAQFAEKVRELLLDKAMAGELVRRTQAYIVEHYDQRKVLARLLEQVQESSLEVRAR